VLYVTLVHQAPYRGSAGGDYCPSHPGVYHPPNPLLGLCPWIPLGGLPSLRPPAVCRATFQTVPAPVYWRLATAAVAITMYCFQWVSDEPITISYCQRRDICHNNDDAVYFCVGCRSRLVVVCCQRRCDINVGVDCSATRFSTAVQRCTCWCRRSVTGIVTVGCWAATQRRLPIISHLPAGTQISLYVDNKKLW